MMRPKTPILVSFVYRVVGADWCDFGSKVLDDDITLECSVSCIEDLEMCEEQIKRLLAQDVGADVRCLNFASFAILSFQRLED